MTQEEIINYNKRCAEFLGWKYCENDLVFNSKVDGHPSHNSVFSGWVKKEQPYTKGVPLFVVKQNRIEIEHKRKLLYHSDWNWIMKVIKAIIKISNNDSSDTTLQTRKRDVQYILMSTEKEAVVQAINQFLIWYKNEQRT